MDRLERVKKGFQGIDVDGDVKERALAHLAHWLTAGEFQAYRPQIEWLIDQGNWLGLLDRFYQILPFGTGGRRGSVGIGPNRMNAWTLTASVQGHCEYLKERFPAVRPIKVVVAYDVRRFEDAAKRYNPALPNPVLHLSSKDLARHAVEVYAANGIQCYVLPPESPRYLSTPELSFSIRFYQGHGGLNLSASHNPADDNGGKFYDERGGQPVPPDDQIMAELVEEVRAIRTLPWLDAVRSGKVTLLDDAAHQAYIDLTRKQSLLGPAKAGELAVLFTPLHGVGGSTVGEVLEKQNFRVLPVPEQMTPDGRFPNVRSANPEEPKSMDRAVELAKQSAAELILSSDPDADRLGAMTPDPREGGWRFLTGNQLCALLTHFKLRQLAEQGRMPASPIVIKTLVTSALVTRIARGFGCQVVENLLVGFKYIADVLWKLESTGRYEDVEGSPDDLVMAVEESHGYLTTPHIRDKDAAGAALLTAELALFQKRRGFTIVDYLEQLWREFGYFHNRLQTVALTGVLGKQQMERMLDSLRRQPPDEAAGLQVTSFEDLRDERGRLGPLKGQTDAANRNLLVLTFGERARASLRPSGTEPKAKVYIEAASPPRKPNMTLADWHEQCRATDELAQRLGQEILRLANERAQA